GPALEVERISAREDHAVDTARSAEHFAACVIDPPTVHERLRLGSISPIVETAPDGHREGCRHVDEDVPAIIGLARFEHQDHAVRALHVAGENTGGEAIFGGVRARDHLVLAIEREDRHYRTEYLFAHDRHLVRAIREHGRLDEKTGFEVRWKPARPPPAHDDP